MAVDYLSIKLGLKAPGYKNFLNSVYIKVEKVSHKVDQKNKNYSAIEGGI